MASIKFMLVILLCIGIANCGREHGNYRRRGGDKDSGERGGGKDSGEHRDGDDSREHGRPKPNRDSSSEEDSSDDDSSYPPKIWLDNLHPQQKVLNLAYLDSNLAVYFDQNVNRSAKWNFDVISNAWRYVKLRYGPFQSSEEPWLWLKIHSDKAKSQLRSSCSYNGRNVIDIATTAEDVKEDSIVQMAKLIQSSYKSVNFTCLLDNVAPPWSLIVYDIYRNVSKHCADQFLQRLREFRPIGSNPKCSKIGFQRFYYPLYSQKNCPKLLIKFFSLVKENVKDAKLPLTREEFVHFWSAVVKLDLKLLFESAFQLELNKNEIENAKKKFSNLTYCSAD